MADIRIKWEAPLNQAIVDSIAIYRYDGITTDCAEVSENGVLLTDTLASDSTVYDDLDTPELGLITYGVFSKNPSGLSQCALSSISLEPTISQSPTALITIYLDSSNAPSGLTQVNADFTVGPESLTCTLELNPKYGVDVGYYVYPFFLSQAEADYFDSQNGGSGSNHSMTYQSVTYYMPDNGGTHSGSSAPSDIVINGNTFSYDKIDTGVEVAKLDESEEAPTGLTAVEEVTIVAPTSGPTELTSVEEILAPTSGPTELTSVEEVQTIGASRSISASQEGTFVLDKQTNNLTVGGVIKNLATFRPRGVFLSDVTYFAEQEGNVIYQKTDGKFYGRNYYPGSYGEMGQGTGENELDFHDIIDVLPSQHNTAVIRGDNSLWVVGYNYRGQLGVDPVPSNVDKTDTSGNVSYTFNDSTLGDQYSSYQSHWYIFNWTKVLEDVSKIVYNGTDSMLVTKTDGSLWRAGLKRPKSPGDTNAFELIQPAGTNIKKATKARLVKPFDGAQQFEGYTLLNDSNEVFDLPGDTGSLSKIYDNVLDISVMSGQHGLDQSYIIDTDGYLHSLLTDTKLTALGAGFTEITGAYQHAVAIKSDGCVYTAGVENKTLTDGVMFDATTQTYSGNRTVAWDERYCPLTKPTSGPTDLTSVEENTTPVLGDLLTNTLATDVDLDMLYVEPGTFTMGSPTTEAGRATNETEHNVTLTQGFYLGKYEVTQAQYEAVMTGNTDSLSATPSQWPNNPNRPVEKVSWNDVQIFLTRLNAQQSANIPAGWVYALPTEAQWEYACRAGTSTVYSWGDTIAPSNANYSSSGLNQTSDVRNYAANPWGFFDMHGNVFEWTADAWGNHATGAQTDPTGAASGSDRVFKGGAYSHVGTDLRSAYRSLTLPSSRANKIGFRVALVQEEVVGPTELTSVEVPVETYSNSYSNLRVTKEAGTDNITAFVFEKDGQDITYTVLPTAQGFFHDFHLGSCADAHNYAIWDTTQTNYLGDPQDPALEFNYQDVNGERQLLSITTYPYSNAPLDQWELIVEYTHP